VYSKENAASERKKGKKQKEKRGGGSYHQESHPKKGETFLYSPREENPHTLRVRGVTGRLLRSHREKGRKKVEESILHFPGEGGGTTLFDLKTTDEKR